MSEIRKFEDEMTEAEMVRTDVEYEAHEAWGRLAEAQAQAAALVLSADALAFLAFTKKGSE